MKNHNFRSFFVLISMLLSFSFTQAQCPYSPLSPSGNLVSDPECNTPDFCRSWGSYSQISDANAYCGTSLKLTGGCGGSLDYNLNSVSNIAANTAYRLRAMIYTNGTASITLHGCGINGSTNEYHYDFNTESSWKQIDFVFTTGTLATSGGQWFYINSCGYSATDIRLDNFEIFPYTAPTLSTSTSLIVFEGTNNTSFTVTGLNQSSPVTLTAPTGITLSTYSLPANPSATSISVTYDGTTSVADTIRLSSGTAKAKIAVQSFNTACFTPSVSQENNMIPDPRLSSISSFGGWGFKSVVTGSEAYCGYGCVKFTALTNGWPDGAALDVPNINWVANQTYRFRAMVKATDGSVSFLAKNTDPDFLYVVPQSADWTQIDQTFTTGANPTSGFFTFNNVDGSATGKIIYIDNYELWPVSTTTFTQSINALLKPKTYIRNNTIVTDFELSKPSDVEISIFNPQGVLLKRTIDSYDAGKNSKAMNLNLKSGMYLVVVDQNGKSSCTKVIK